MVDSLLIIDGIEMLRAGRFSINSNSLNKPTNGWTNQWKRPLVDDVVQHAKRSTCQMKMAHSFIIDWQPNYFHYSTIATSSSIDDDQLRFHQSSIQRAELQMLFNSWLHLLLDERCFHLSLHLAASMTTSLTSISYLFIFQWVLIANYSKIFLDWLSDERFFDLLLHLAASMTTSFISVSYLFIFQWVLIANYPKIFLNWLSNEDFFDLLLHLAASMTTSLTSISYLFIFQRVLLQMCSDILLKSTIQMTFPQATATSSSIYDTQHHFRGNTSPLPDPSSVPRGFSVTSNFFFWTLSTAGDGRWWMKQSTGIISLR